MLETLRKLAGVITNTRLKACIPIHEFLHGFCTGRVTGKAILEIKLAQELARIDQDSLFLVFLDLCKEYKTLDRVHLLTAMEGYGSRLHMCRILAEFW